MILWLDAHLSPRIARWISESFGCSVVPVRELGLREANDREIYNAARQAGITVMTKDADFTVLQQQLGPPPQIIWLRCGNTSNARLREILGLHLQTAINLLGAGEPMVEIVDND